MRAGKMLAALFAATALSGCGYNTLQSQDEQVKAAWSEVLNQYQRRADLVPNLVATVKGYAAQEQAVDFRHGGAQFAYGADVRQAGLEVRALRREQREVVEFPLLVAAFDEIQILFGFPQDA